MPKPIKSLFTSFKLEEKMYSLDFFIFEINKNLFELESWSRTKAMSGREREKEKGIEKLWKRNLVSEREDVKEGFGEEERVVQLHSIGALL